MSNYTHQTAPTQFVEAAGIRFAYRRFANRRSGVTIDIPLLFFMHFTGRRICPGPRSDLVQQRRRLQL